MQRLADALGSVASDLAAIAGELRDASAQDLGGRVLDRPAELFQDRWAHGLGGLADSTDAARVNLRKCVALYAQAEQQNAVRFGLRPNAELYRDDWDPGLGPKPDLR